MWDRMNPFSARPPGSTKKRSPPDFLDERQSFSLATVDRTPCPAPPSSPIKQKTTSIIRTLAHHPSLSALKSKSRNKRLAKRRPTIPASTSAPFERLSDGIDGEIPGSPSPTKLNKGSLKQSRSVPRDLRLYGGITHPRASSESESYPPMPSTGYRCSTRPSSSLIGEDRQNTEITVRHDGWDTPDGVQIRRMSFEFELDSPRKRATSDSAGLLSPQRTHRSLPNRHRSSPASPFPAPPIPPLSSRLPTLNRDTTQHPHPVPLPAESPDYDATEYFDTDDFIPLTQSGHTVEVEDGLGLLVSQEDLPTGTPGGTKADLRHGALIDGARHEKDAVRFFSRDTYGHRLSSTPTPSPSASPAPASNNDKQNRRSSSPFEVKLSPMVARRISLDAFGGPIPPFSGGDPLEVEEVLEEHEVLSDPLANFLGTSLSTIKESPSSRGDQSVFIDFTSTPPPNRIDTSSLVQTTQGNETRAGWRPKTPRAGQSDTQYFTPDSSPMKKSSFGLPLPAASPFLPPRHHSAPPLALTMALLDAQSEHGKRLQAEVKYSRSVIEGLEAELRHFRDTMGEEVDERKRLLQSLQGKENTVLTLQDRLAESEQARRISEDQTRMHQDRIIQLQAAEQEREYAFDTLQHDHEELASRYVDILQERDALASARHQDAATLNTSRDAQEALRLEVRALRKANKAAGAQRVDAEHHIMELQRSQADTEAQLEATVDDFTSHLASHQDELTSTKRQIVDRNTVIAGLQAQLQDLKENQIAIQSPGSSEALESVRSSALHREARISELEAELLHKAELGDAERLTINEKLHSAFQRLADKDSTVSQLRDKLQTAAFESDERTVQLEGLRAEMLQLSQQVVDKESTVLELAELVSILENKMTFWEDERIEIVNELGSTQRVVDSLQAELQEAETDSYGRSQMVDYYEREIKHLRMAVGDAEEALVTACEDAERDAKEAGRTTGRLTEQLLDRQSELGSSQAALQHSTTGFALERAKADDARSRLEAYLAEVDRLKLVEAGLGKQVDDLRRTSALDEMKRLDLSKRITELEKDKELLNVALDSKQTELVLLQRSTRPAGATPRPSQRKSEFSLSTSRVVHTPTPHDVTPFLSHRLSSSVSASSVRPAQVKRESSVLSSPATPRSNSRGPLGSSTKHNTPERSKPYTAAKPVKAVAQGSRQPGLTRRSSVPVLVAGKVSTTSTKVRVGSLAEEEERLEVLW